MPDPDERWVVARSGSLGRRASNSYFKAGAVALSHIDD